MKIVVDCRFTRIGRHDGISRYTAGIVSELGKLHSITMLINDLQQLELLPDLPWKLISSPTSLREPWVARQVNELDPDVVFSPMQTMGSWGRRYRLVLTVHDLIYYRHPTPPRDLAAPLRALWRLYHLSWWPQRFLLNRADAVVAVSETTKDLLRRHRLTHRRITVVPNAATVPEITTPDRPFAERTKSLVYMGSFMPYKNVETLVRAMQDLPEYTLHLMSRVSDADRARLQALPGGDQVVFHHGADDQEYHALLARSLALLSASKDEGFGISLVEAMTHGTPVILSDIPIFAEIAGEAGLFVTAEDASGFAQAVRRLEDESEWTHRSVSARMRAGHYAWDSSAAALFAVLQKVGGQPKLRDRSPK